MGLQNESKLNKLQQLLGEGQLASSAWLAANGYSRALVSKYVKGCWLDSPARGVYRRPGPPLKWQHVVASLQRTTGSALHVGGRSALVHRGLGHYLQLSGGETIHLYGAAALPSWVGKLDLPERFVMHSDAMFRGLRVFRGEEGELLDARGAQLEPRQFAERGLQQMTWGAWDWPLLYASDERAILEVLQDVPAEESIHEADVLMQALGNLRPGHVTTLLRACTSVKVKRLFLALAERHRHPWLPHLNLEGVNLGKGKRMLEPGGKLHPKYLITLPVDLGDHSR
jgi:hypothetical protein